MKIKLPCGRIVEKPDGVSEHFAIEDECIDHCEYGGPPPIGTCGAFYDWFIKNHMREKVTFS